MQSTPDSLPPQGRYRPIATLGQGGMARVLLTVSTGPAGVQKLLVVKEIRPELAHDTEFVTMFMDEARLAARLSHRNIVHTYDVGLDMDGEHPRPFMVMEYLEGQSLQALINRVRRDAMPLEMHLRILAQTLAGLHYAHELRDFDGTPLQVVHRDVTPQNVFVCYDGQVKLVDFGIAKAAGSAARTEAGTFKGKLGYVAPEQIAGDAVDRRADVFSVGVMLWEALAKRRLTAGETEGAVLHKRTHGTQLRIAEVAPETPEALARICDRAMELDPTKRYATAAEFQAVIEAYLDEAGLTRTSDRDVGALVEQAFEAERVRIRAVIEQQLASITKMGTGSYPSVLPSLNRVEAPHSARSETTSNPHTLASAIPVHTSSPPPPGTPNTSQAPAFTVTNPRQRIPKGPAVAIAVMAVLGIAAGVAIFASSGKGTTPPTVGSNSTTEATTLATTPSSQNGTTGTMAISATPAGATILLDGKPLTGNPFRGAIPLDGSTHVLTVSADHHQPETRKVTYSSDVNETFALKSAPSGFVGGFHPSGLVTSTPSATAPSTTATTPPTATTKTDPGAGSDLTKDPRTHHGIDEKDPY